MGQERTANVVQQLAQGKSITSIAKDIGVSRQTVHRLVKQPATLQALAQLVDEREDDIRRIFNRALRVVYSAMSAKDYAVTYKAVKKVCKDDVPTEEEMFLSPPDHYARLAAVSKFRELMVAGRPRHGTSKRKASASLPRSKRSTPR